MIYKVKHGRPSNYLERIKEEQECYNILDALNIEYDRVDHEPIFDMSLLKDVRDSLGVSVNKNLFLCNTQKTRFYLLLMPGNKPFKTKELSHQINSSRLSFAPGEYLEEMLRVTPGSTNILSLMYDTDNKVQLLIDEDLLKVDYMGLHPMINTTSLKIKNSDIKRFLDHIHHEPIVVTLVGE